MPMVAVAGGQWGDEGKGKIVDLLAQRAGVVVRAQGGDNAGHTVVNPAGTFKLRGVPAGIFNPRTTCIIGAGVALNPQGLVAELEALAARGVSTENLIISPRAHLVLPHHRLLDSLEEAGRGEGRLGTTGRGIGPAYEDKVARRGVRAGDLLEPERLRDELQRLLAFHNPRIQALGGERLQPGPLLAEMTEVGARLAGYVADPTPRLRQALAKQELILLEGAQGTLLDIDHGTYPFVTSSAPTVAGLLCGAGLGPSFLSHSVGVFKAYATRVGRGPMPSELEDERGGWLRQRGQEYGTVTGRPRRCGWFDLVAARHAQLVNGFSALALSRLDVLSGLPEVGLLTAYQRDGRRLSEPPASAQELALCRPLVEMLPGWEQPLGAARRWRELPLAARHYAQRISRELGCPLALVGVGESREASIPLAAPFL